MTQSSLPQLQSAVDLLFEIQKLMELKGENPFKIRAYERASHALAEGGDLRARALAGTLTEIPGIGKGISDVLTEFLLQGKSSLKEELQRSLPPGLVELVEIPGVGPKKALKLIEELGIQSRAELEYACRENRLLQIKGFGKKAQEKILESIAFLNSNQGQQRLSDLESMLMQGMEEFKKQFPGCALFETGALRRKVEVLDRLEFLLPAGRGEAEDGLNQILKYFGNTLPVSVVLAAPNEMGYQLARTTGTEAHWKALGNPKPFLAATEEAFYERLGLPWISPEMREWGTEVELARNGKLKEMLSLKGIQGVFHNHTTRSDGTATLEQMVQQAISMGYSYLGISDHSQSAFYAQGLKNKDLDEQEKELRKVQEKYPNFRIFWGVESDILADGSLDYEDETLKRFDFVIASIHSRFQMDRDAMTERVLRAVRNPRTRFLGHPTGRIVLGRKGFDIDLEKVIAEAARCGVAVEINSNPSRLDLDWRWGECMRTHQTWTSINPDAHDLAGLADTRFGITLARKALIPAARVVNSMAVHEVEKWLKR